MIPKPDKKSKDYTSATIGVPVTLGHRTCVPKASSPGGFVPKRMGWLWTARNVPAHPFDPAWRPGAVHRGILGPPIFKLKKRKGKKGFKSPKRGASTTKSIRSKSKAKLSTKSSKASSNIMDPVAVKSSRKLRKKSSLKSILSKKKMSTIGWDTDSESEDDGVQPMFLLQKREGNIKMTMNQVKNPRTRSKKDMPFDANLPPFVIDIPAEEGAKEALDMKKYRKSRRRKMQRRVLFEQAIDTICKQLYQNIDPEKIREEAEMTHQCPCHCLQDYVLKYLSKVYANVKPGEGGEMNILQSIIEEEGLLRMEPVAEVISSDEDWTVEFTPPCAVYDPLAKEMELRTVEMQTMKPRGGGEDNIFSKSVMSLK